MIQHLVIDSQMLGRGGDYILADQERMFNFLLELVAALKMRILSGPEIKRGHIDLPGISGQVMIETSHINIHTFTRTGDIRFDVFSCLPFHQSEVEQLFRKFYPCDMFISQVINRQPVLVSDYKALRKAGT
jgi:S-adenosylmethionine decarboxylase